MNFLKTQVQNASSVPPSTKCSITTLKFVKRPNNSGKYFFFTLISNVSSSKTLTSKSFSANSYNNAKNFGHYESKYIAMHPPNNDKAGMNFNKSSRTFYVHNNCTQHKKSKC